MTLLSVRDLAKSFGGVDALGGVDFDLHQGEMLALIGPNGAGKSTCFHIVGGQLRSDRGQVRLDGQDITGLPSRRIWRMGVGRTFQIAAVFPSLTVRENVQTALISLRRRAFDPWSRGRDVEGERADRLLADVGMAALADRPCRELAYGDLKRLELAVALANAPRVLLLDEPMAGVAVGDRGPLMSLVGRVARDSNIGVLFTEHDMSAVFGHADRIIVLDRGAIVAMGDPETVRADHRVREIYLGEDAATREAPC